MTNGALSIKIPIHKKINGFLRAEECVKTGGWRDLWMDEQDIETSPIQMRHALFACGPNVTKNP